MGLELFDVTRRRDPTKRVFSSIHLGRGMHWYPYCWREPIIASVQVPCCVTWWPRCTSIRWHAHVFLEDAALLALALLVRGPVMANLALPPLRLPRIITFGAPAAGGPRESHPERAWPENA